jgi:integrase
MGYARLRIGEVEQLRWEDFQIKAGRLTMIHVRRGGSRGVTIDRQDRFVPVHPTVAELLLPGWKEQGLVFQNISERKLLKRIKQLATDCRFENPKQFKLHSFRHHFASLCANQQVAHRKVLAWLGHSSSEMLDLYYHLQDEDSHQTMMALAKTAINTADLKSDYSLFEGNGAVENRENAANT